MRTPSRGKCIEPRERSAKVRRTVSIAALAVVASALLACDARAPSEPSAEGGNVFCTSGICVRLMGATKPCGSTVRVGEAMTIFVEHCAPAFAAPFEIGVFPELENGDRILEAEVANTVPAVGCRLQHVSFRATGVIPPTTLPAETRVIRLVLTGSGASAIAIAPCAFVWEPSE
jgi:hypothetical protein